MKLLNKVGLVVLMILGLAQIAAAQQHMIGYAGFAGFQVSMWAVKDLGLLKKYGLEGEPVLVPGTSRQIQALVGDSIQFAHVDAAGHIRAVMRGADIVMVSGSLNKFPFSLVTLKEIRKPADLIGKKIGIVGFGGGNDLGPQSHLAAQHHDAFAHIDANTLQLAKKLEDLGFLDGPQVETIYEEMRTSDATLGEIAIQRGLLNEDQLLQATAELHGMRVANLEGFGLERRQTAVCAAGAPGRARLPQRPPPRRRG